MRVIASWLAHSFWLVGIFAFAGCQERIFEDSNNTEDQDDHDDGELARCPIGDLSLEPEIGAIVYRNPEGVVLEAEENAEVPLLPAPAGGQLMAVSVRARNLDCHLQIEALIRDRCTNSVVGLDSRNTQLVGDGSKKGWGLPSEGYYYSSIPACPRQQLSRNVHGEQYVLEVHVQDRDGRMAERSVSIYPSCSDISSESEGDSRCLCECAINYAQGGCIAIEESGMVAPTCSQ